jgi:tetratricopeptide (TPR) repeat protein
MPLSYFDTCALRLTAMAALLACVNAHAQSDSAITLERQTDAAFQQVLQQPQNLSLWSTYADLLIKQGNYEGGVAALERLLLEPDAKPELRVDIGVLYYRMASYTQAEVLLREALENPRLQADKRALATALLADIAKRQQTSQFSGAVTFGLRYQSNAMFRTDSSQLTVAGVQVPTTLRPESNTDASLGLRLRHFYDFDAQNSAGILTNFGAFMVNYRSSAGNQVTANPTRPYDLLGLDLSSGIRFKPLPADLPDVTLRPHLLWSNVLAQGKQYFGTQGVGLDASWQASEKTLIDFTVDTQTRTFASRLDVPNPDQLNARLTNFRARVAHEVASGHVLTGDYVMRRTRAGRDFLSSDSHELRVTYAMSYASPLKDGSSWTTSVYAGALRRSFNAPDPAVSATQKRGDNESRLGVNHLVPITPVWSLLFALEQARNRANFANFNYKNNSLSGTVIRSF